MSLPATTETHPGEDPIIISKEVTEAHALLQKIIELTKSANRVLWAKPEEVTQADREAFTLLEAEGIVKSGAEKRDNQQALGRFRSAVHRILQGDDVDLVHEVRVRSLMIELRRS